MAQLLQPSSLGAGWGGRGQPGILISSPGPPFRSLRTSRKDPAVCGGRWWLGAMWGTGARKWVPPLRASLIFVRCQTKEK